jgi:LPS sulfotransferase NodH
MSHLRFVVLSAPRSGTTNLVARLNRSDSILMHEEIFHRDIWRVLREESPELRDIHPPSLQAIAYAEGVLSECPAGKSQVGFKMWRTQSPEACQHVLRDRRIHKIILERKNRLASYASLTKALSTGVWNVSRQDSPGAGYATETVRFDADKFLEHVKRQDEAFDYYREQSHGPTLDVSYTGLVAESDHRRCLDFLGLEMPDRDHAEEYQRLNTPDILSRFAESDRAAVVSVITELGHPEWAGIEC